MTIATSVPAGTTFSGTRLLDSGHALATAIRNGNWLDGGMAFLDTLGNAAAALADPIATLTSIGLGWVLEHLKPLSTWLEQLAGSEANVASVAGQWTSAGQTLRQTGVTLDSRLRDLEGLSGGTVGAYLRFARDTSQHLSASGDWAAAAATGFTSASTLVSKMQGVVKSAISQVVTVAIEAMAVVAASLGLGMGYAIARVVMKVNQMVNKVVRPIASVVKSVKSLMGLVQQVRTLFDGTSDKAASQLRSTPQQISINAGAVADASAATQFGNSASANLIQVGLVADSVKHTNTPVIDLARTDTSLLTSLGGADAPTADGGVTGVSMLGGAGGGPGAGGTLTVNGAGGAVGLGGSGGSLAGSASSGSMQAAGITGTAALAGGTAAVTANSTTAAGGRPMMGPMTPVSAGAGGARSGLGMRRRPLSVVIQPMEDEVDEVDEFGDIVDVVDETV